MFAGVKRFIGLISVREMDDHIVIEGLPDDSLAKDILNQWNTSRINKYLFSAITRGRVSFCKFFAIDVLYMLQTLNDEPRTSTPKRTLRRILDELLEKTWLKDVEEHERVGRLNFGKLSLFNRKPLPSQKAFLDLYDVVVPQYRLNGMILAAPPGSGKTLNGLMLAETLESDLCIVVCPLNAVVEVWGMALETEFVKTPKYWLSTMPGEIPLDRKYYVFHYEQLDRVLPLIQAIRPKKLFVDLDESHNLNDIKSLRTQLFVDACQKGKAEDVLWASGTPIKAMGAEMVPCLKTIDRFFTKDAEERFKKIFGRDAKRANDILRNRVGLVSFKVPKQDVVKTEVIYHTIDVKIPNGDLYTLDTVKAEMKAFVEERLKFYKSRMKEYEEQYRACIELHANTLKTDKDKKDFDYYKESIKQIRRNYDPVTMKDQVLFCNKYELTKIIPSLPDQWRKPFKALRSIIKYVELKVMGEALGGVLGKKRAQCHVDMLPHIPFAKTIDEARKKTLIFTSYVEVIRALDPLLKELGYKPAMVFGETNKELTTIRKQFHDDPDLNPVGATYKSLSTAVPMTAANTLLMLNSPFREHERNQAISRANRLGQDEDVHVFDVFLDTGNKPNISTRSKDILEWSRDQVEAILGVHAPADLEASLESMMESMVPIEVSAERFVLSMEEAYKSACAS